MKTWRSALGKN